jgi:hypothetical protein
MPRVLNTPANVVGKNLEERGDVKDADTCTVDVVEEDLLTQFRRHAEEVCHCGRLSRR